MASLCSFCCGSRDCTEPFLGVCLNLQAKKNPLRTGLPKYWMEEELKNAYFAGLIDGEGNVASYPHKRKLTNKIVVIPRPVVKVNMTCHKTISSLAEHFGGYVVVKKVPIKNKPQWEWGVTFNKAIEVLRKIRPYLITKADVADSILLSVDD
jgi:hypothetical protein